LLALQGLHERQVGGEEQGLHDWLREGEEQDWLNSKGWHDWLSSRIGQPCISGRQGKDMPS